MDSVAVLWLEVCKSNNSPIEPTKFYLDCVEEHGGCPLMTCTDYGTENCNIAALQSYFRSDEDAHKYGTSTRNQRIENWWSHFRKSCAHFWINFFKDQRDNSSIDLEQLLHRECLWFCFSGIVQSSLNRMKEYWNTHYIRPSRHDTIPGVPDILFYLPERSNGSNCLVPVSNDRITEDVRELRQFIFNFQYFVTCKKSGFKSDIIITQSLANVQINTCDKYVTSHIHEQKLVIDNFCLPHKNWQTSFSANVFAT